VNDGRISPVELIDNMRELQAKLYFHQRRSGFWHSKVRRLTRQIREFDNHWSLCKHFSGVYEGRNLNAGRHLLASRIDFAASVTALERIAGVLSCEESPLSSRQVTVNKVWNSGTTEGDGCSGT
jgi:hypothetical protein